MTKTPRCKVCWHPIEPGAKVCHNCGAELPGVKLTRRLVELALIAVCAFIITAAGVALAGLLSAL